MSDDDDSFRNVTAKTMRAIAEKKKKTTLTETLDHIAYAANAGLTELINRPHSESTQGLRVYADPREDFYLTKIPLSEDDMKELRARGFTLKLNDRGAVGAFLTTQDPADVTIFW